jgi:subtilisin family serine protease
LRRRRSRLLATLYYTNDPMQTNTAIYYDFPNAIVGSYKYRQVDGDGQASSVNGSFSYSGSVFKDVDDNAAQFVETLIYTNGKAKKASTFSAYASYNVDTVDSVTTTVSQVTFRVTAGTGAYRKAKFAIIDYDNQRQLRTVRVFA